MKRSILSVLALTFGLSLFFSARAFAAENITETGLYTDGHDVRWEYSIFSEVDGDEKEYKGAFIRFFDKPADLTEIVIPSIEEVADIVDGVTSISDTAYYYLLESSDETYGETKRISTADVTKLDMSNGHDVVVLDAKSILNPAVETELIFGDGLVIGDYGPQYDKGDFVTLYYTVKDDFYNLSNSGGTVYYGERFIPNWDEMSVTERENAGTDNVDKASFCLAYFGIEQCNGYLSSFGFSRSTSAPAGTFAGYNLKLTDLQKAKYIGQHAFYGATFAESSVDLTIAFGQTIGQAAFANTNIKSINYDAASVGDSAFLACKSLESITLGEHVTEIRGNAFAETTAFTGTITLPASLETMMGEAFRNSGVSGIVFGGGMTTLDFRTFMNTHIANVDFTNSGVTEIRNQAFAFATIDDINFGSVTSLEFAAFAHATFTKPLSFAGSSVKTIGVQTFESASLTIGDFGDVNTLNYGSFARTNLGEVDFSNSSITFIPVRAFYDAGITSVNLDGVNGISYEAFAFNNLTELYLPKSINNLNSVRLFVGNYNLTKLTIAYDTLTSGTSYPFHHVLGEKHDETTNGHRSMAHTITDITLIAPYGEDEEVSETHNKYNQHSPFSGVDHNYLDDFDERYGKADTYKNVLAPFYFYGFTYVENLTVGEGYEFIGTGTFYTYASKNPSGGYGDSGTWYDYLINNKDTQALKNISLPSTLKGIGANAFAQNFQELNINLPESLEYIGEKAFFNDANMKNDIDLPNLRYIGKHAFYSAGIHNLYLHDKLIYVGASPFMGCYNLHDVTYDYDIFGVNGGAIFYNSGEGSEAKTFGAGMLTARPNITNSAGVDNNVPIGMFWSQQTHKLGTITFTDKVVTEPLKRSDSRESAQSYPWFYIVAAEKIDLGKCGWKTLGGGAFLGANVGEIILPENLEYIGPAAFQSLILEEELIIPDSVKVIGNNAFNNYAVTFHDPYDRPIKITKLPTSLEYVGGSAFALDYELETDFDLPNLKVIGRDAFSGTSIRDVTLHESIVGIYKGAFQQTKTLRNITIDCDFFNAILNPESPYNYSYAGYSPENSYGSSVVDTFYGVFRQMKDAERLRYYSSYQNQSVDSYGKIKFTEKAATRPYGYNTENDYRNGNASGNVFALFTIDELDLSETPWNTLDDAYFLNGATIGKLTLPQNLEEICDGAFFGATIAEPVNIPSAVKAVGKAAFQESEMTIENAFAEGLETIGSGAFYAAKISGDLMIPSTVGSIGWSAFNAGDADTNYGTVTIKPALDYDSSSSQAIFQMFLNAKMDKLVIESPMLPVLATTGENPILPHEIQYQTVVNGRSQTVTVTPTLRADGEPEFHGMTMREVVVTALPEITANSFEECGNLEKATFSSDANLNHINKYAFNNATKLEQVVFGEANNNKDINLHEYAFNNTAIETMGDKNTGFALTEANFRLADEHVFSNMPSLKTVDIPNNFNIDESLANEEKFVNGAHITSFTFSDDPELSEVTIGYQVSEIRDGAFLNDEKLAKLFVWGNTEIQETDQLIQDFNNTTIPKGTMIFAYSDAPAETYANDASRDNYDGKFYALDEVLYLTTNRTYVVLNDDKDDFDKEGLKLYALRRDGVILESDDWQEYTTAFPRSTANINFEEGRGGLGDDSASIAAIVYDAEKPFNTISLANQNYANVDFEFATMPSSDNPLVLIHYPDGYTSNIRTATLASMTKAEEEEYLRRLKEELEVPNTGVFLEVMKVATPAVSLSAIIIAGALMVTRKRR